MAFPVLLPLVFASSAFVPVSTMPGWLQVFAEHQPVTATVNAVRALTIGGPTTTYVLTALAWSIGMIIAFAPAGVRTYRKVK
jgi:ABC-2 type transport system permease protein/oleandomycin transport system permease protein